MYVVDTRPKINAMANKAQGKGMLARRSMLRLFNNQIIKLEYKGYENENNYSNIQFHFIGIENIHVMRNSLNKLLEGRFMFFKLISYEAESNKFLSLFSL